MTKPMAPETINVLRALRVNGTSTLRELTKALPGVQNIASRINNLQAAFYILAEPGQSAKLYSITATGKKHLDKLDAPKGEVVKAPIPQAEYEPYKPTPHTYTRAGSDTAFTLQSLQNGQRVDRVRPALIASKDQPKRVV